MLPPFPNPNIRYDVSLLLFSFHLFSTLSSMATEYERKRLENIRRNDEMLAALNVHSKVSLLSSSSIKPKSFKKKKTTKPETPFVIRKSLRTRGLNPDSAGLPDEFSDFPKRMPPTSRISSSRLLAPHPFDGDASHTKFLHTMLSIARKSVKVCKDENDSAHLSNNVVKKEEPHDFDFPVKPEKIEFDLESFSLEPHNVARVVPERIFALQFLPCQHVNLIAAGDKYGNVGFWHLNSDHDDDDDDGIYLFHPHSGPVSSLLFQQNSFSKVISSSYDGLIRMMDVEKSVFDLVYSPGEDQPIFSLSQRPNDEQSLYFSEGYGMFKIWDLRAGKSFSHWDLHENRINTIDFNPQNPHVMATSSTDGTACLWDLRNMGAKPIRTVDHSRAVHSAYFSPSGLSLATTSVDNNLGILSGVNYEDTSMIYHDNSTNRWISSFRGVWGWDDSYIFVGSRSKGVDVISPKQKRTVKELRNPLMKAIPCRIQCHPLNVGMLAGSTAGGQVYVWTTK